MFVLVTAGFCSSALADPDACDPGDSTVAARTDNVSDQEHFRIARTLAEGGEYDAAILKYRQLSLQDPDNVDYLFGEAQARFWSGQSECALRLVSRARQFAPDYEDVWKLEYQVLEGMREPESGGHLNALQLDAFREAASARFPGAAWIQEDRVRETATWRWETGINRETLDNGAADWQNIYAYIDRRSADHGLLSLMLAEHRRFSLSDNEVAIGAGWKPADFWVVDGSLTLSPNADFLPEMIIDAGASRQLGSGWVAGIDLRHRSYADDTVSSWGLNVEYYFGRFRTAYYIDNTRFASTSSLTHRGVVNYYSQSGTQYGLTIAAGDEIEIIAPGQLLEMDTSSVALSGRHPLGQRFSVLWRVGTHRQGSIYRRNNIGLSIAGEF